MSFQLAALSPSQWPEYFPTPGKEERVSIRVRFPPNTLCRALWGRESERKRLLRYKRHGYIGRGWFQKHMEDTDIMHTHMLMSGMREISCGQSRLHYYSLQRQIKATMISMTIWKPDDVYEMCLLSIVLFNLWTEGDKEGVREEGDKAKMS